MNRRNWIASCAAAMLAGSQKMKAQATGGGAGAGAQGTPDLPLWQYVPKSMLKVTETHVARCRFPLIDLHTHITCVRGNSREPVLRFGLEPEKCLEVMDRKNIKTMVDLTGGYGSAL